MMTDEPVKQESKWSMHEPWIRGRNCGKFKMFTTDEIVLHLLTGAHVGNGELPLKVTINRVAYTDVTLGMLLLSGKDDSLLV